MTMNQIRRAARSFGVLTLALTGFASVANAQAAKEPTDGFFDVPARTDDKVDYGVPAYLVTSALGGGAVFVACKSARRA